MNASLVEKYALLGMTDEHIAAVLDATVESVELIARPIRERVESERRSEAGKRAAQTRSENKRDREEKERRDVTQRIQAALAEKSAGKQRQDESEAIARVIARLHELGRDEDAARVQSIYESLD